MKKCPGCQKVYEDETLRFCLECGAMLVPFVSNEPPATLQMPYPRDTSPPPGNGPRGPNPTGFGGASNASGWNNTPLNTAVPQAKKGGSGCLYWVIGILVGGALLGILGFIGLIALGLMIPDEANLNKNTRIEKPSPKNGNTKTPFDSPPTAAGSLRIKADFSKWRLGSDAYATRTFAGGEYQVASSRENYFYVLLAAGDYTPGKGFSTSRAITKMTVHSVTGTSPNLGYGVVIHSDPKPLKRGYAFLIRTGSSPAYRIVQHTDSDEKTLVEWTNSDIVHTGTAPNDLEVRTDGSKLDFYINGKFAAGITDEISDGIAGIYVSDTTPIAFNKLEIYDNN